MSENKETNGPAAVGEILKKRRMLRGQSIEAIHQYTRIPKDFIAALEENRIEDFPARVYVRGFLKGYCDYLDLNFEDLWSKLELSPKPAAGGEKRGIFPEKSAGQPRQAFILPFAESTLLPVILFAGLLAAGGFLWLVKSRPAVNPAPVTAAAADAKAGEMSTLTITALKEAWMRLKTDDTLRFEGRLPEATRQEWKAQRVFSLRTSDHSALQIMLNGRETPLSGIAPEPDGSFLLTP